MEKNNFLDYLKIEIVKFADGNSIHKESETYLVCRSRIRDCIINNVKFDKITQEFNIYSVIHKNPLLFNNNYTAY